MQPSKKPAAARKVPDEPDVTGPGGPTLDDIADVLAGTNRGLLEVQRLIRELTAMFLTFLTFWLMLVFLGRTRA